MTGLSVLSLVSALLKLAPEALEMIEEIVGKGKPISSVELPGILTEVAKVASQVGSAISPSAEPVSSDVKDSEASK